MTESLPLTPRPLRQVFCIGAVFVVWMAGAKVYQDVVVRRAAQPVCVELELASPDTLGSVDVRYVDRRGRFCPLARRQIGDCTIEWTAQRVWIAELILLIKPKAKRDVRNISLAVGDRRWNFDKRQWQDVCPPWSERESEIVNEPGNGNSTAPRSWEARRLSETISPGKSLFPAFRGWINFAGDSEFVQKTIISLTRFPPFYLLVGCFVLVLVLRQSFICGWLTGRFYGWLGSSAVSPQPRSTSESPRPHPPSDRCRWWIAAGLLVFICCATLLESQQPYYFTQDDNYAQFLPQILHGCRTVMNGEFPAWNPNQFLGAPLAAVGTYALTYPWTYVSYLAASYLLGDEGLTLEVFCWLHLLAAYLAAFWLGRRLQLAAPLSAAMALSWSLCGFALIAGRSWYYMTPAFAYLPLLGVSLLTLKQRRINWRWTLGTATVIGLFFHAGNAQMWVYGVGFYTLSLFGLLWSKQISWRRLLHAAPGGALGLAAAALLLIPQMNAVGDTPRTASGGGGILPGLHAVLTPIPWGEADQPSSTGTFDDANNRQYYFAGGVFQLAWLLTWLFVWSWRGAASLLTKNPIMILSVLALMLSLSVPGLLWPLQAKLPFLNKLALAAKLLPMFHLFAMVFGALVVHRVLAQRSWGREACIACFGLIALLMTHHALVCRPSFYTFTDRNYPSLPTPVSKALCADRNVRVLAVAPIRSTALGYTFSLMHNFSTVYGIESLRGYDPLLSSKPAWRRVDQQLEENFAVAVRQYGVTHIVVHRQARFPKAGPNPYFFKHETNSLWANESVRRFLRSQPCVLSNEFVDLYEVNDSFPLAFVQGTPHQALPVEKTATELTIDVAAAPPHSTIVVNYFHRPGICVTADGVAFDSTPDEFQRICVQLPPVAQRIRIGHQSPRDLDSPWRRGVLTASLIAALALLMQAGLLFVKDRT